VGWAPIIVVMTIRKRLPRLRARSLALVLAPAVLVAIACVAVMIFDRRADIHHEHADHVKEVRLLATQVSAREWQAVAEGRVGDATVREVDGLLKAMLRDLQSATADGGDAPASLAVLGEYSAAVRDEFAALREGDLEEAEEIDEARVDPAFEALEANVEAVVAGEERDARASARQSLAGSLLAIVLSSSALLGVSLLTLRGRGLLELSEMRQAAARESEQRFAALLRNSSDILLVVDSDGCLRYASESIDRLLGHRADELLGRDVRALLDEADRERLTAQLRRATEQPGRPVVTEWALRTSLGERRHVEAILNDLTSDPRVSGIVVNVRDVTDRRMLEAELRRRAYHDELTGLANRAPFEDRVLEGLEAADRDGQDLAVLFLDLDDFKHVNDSLGHASGDELLRLVAERLDTCVRDGDVVARLGGDEFGILLPSPEGVAGAVMVADRILSALSTPLMVHGHALFVDASVGVALDPAPGEDRHDRLTAILRDADIAMYAAKEAGKHRVEVFETELHAPIVKRLQLKSQLQDALEQEQFVVHYQPVVDLDTDAIVGAEAPSAGSIPSAASSHPETSSRWPSRPASSCRSAAG
jgi:diguanylate cyclase (GGDEF)-like protein/PAS domain S-box-containing protein